jgi:hypothetical protein
MPIHAMKKNLRKSCQHACFRRRAESESRESASTDSRMRRVIAYERRRAGHEQLPPRSRFSLPTAAAQSAFADRAQ